MTESSSQDNKIKALVNEHVFITKYFSMFFSFFKQIEQFLYHWMQKLEGLQMFFKHQK